MWEYILYTVGGTTIGSFIGWLIGRKKQKIDEIDAATDTWSKIVQSLRKQIDDLILDQEAFIEREKQMQQRIDELHEQIKKLQNEIKLLKSK